MNKTKSPEINIQTTTNAKNVQIKISNHGESIAEEILNQIFYPFYTTKKNKLGMGLTIAQTIISNHWGRLYANNLPHGVCINISLPTQGGV